MVIQGGGGCFLSARYPCSLAVDSSEAELALGLGFYLTHRIYLLVLESQLPHKSVNLMFYLGIVNNKLTILWKS